MKAFVPVLLVLLPFFAACEKHGERVLIEETRPSTSKDGDPRMFASSDERFRDAKPSPIKGESPETWLKLPASPMRILNYRFGESGMGEVYASLSAGGVPENVNRWLKQFGKEALSSDEFDALEKLEVVGVQGLWVEAAGTYDPGMGREAKPGFGLAGIVADLDGKIFTVKMIGPEKEVKAEEARLLKYIDSLELTGN